jgi:acetylornithine deacetylase
MLSYQVMAIETKNPVSPPTDVFIRAACAGMLAGSLDYLVNNVGRQKEAIMFNIDEAYLLQTVVQLVQIDSTNPSLHPDGAGEGVIAEYVAARLAELGLAPQMAGLAPGRWNVWANLPGRGRGPALLWNAHMDTVGVSGMAEPFSGRFARGRVYGRGSYDMKGSLAAQLAALKALIDSGIKLRGDVWFTAVADEEHSSIGSEALAPLLPARAAIVTEPTDMTLCRAHRGFIWFDVETIGRAAHGSRFQEGIDANMRMGRFLGLLDGLEQELRGRTAHPLAGPPSLHAAKLHGGEEISVYAAHCLLQLERRTIPGETVEQAAAELQALIDQLAATDPTFAARLQATFWREPFAVDENAPIVGALAAAVEDQLGAPPRHTGQTFWTDAALFAAAGMDAVLIGPRGKGLHSAEEWVDFSSLVDLAAVLVRTAVNYCGT